MVPVLSASTPRFLLDLRREPFLGARRRCHVWIAAGTLDPPTGLRTVAHTYVADAGDYYTIADDLKTYPGTHLTTAVDK